MRQLAHGAKQGDHIEMVLLCMGKGGKGGNSSGQSKPNKQSKPHKRKRHMRGHQQRRDTKFGQSTEDIHTRKQTKRPTSLTCEVLKPLSLVSDTLTH